MANLKIKFLTVATAAVLANTALAKTTLRVATWAPPSHPQNAVVWPTWEKWVEEATEGRIDVVIENYSGHPKSIFSAVEDGIYEAGYSVNAYIPGRFSLTSVAEIPGEITDAEPASGALWKVQQEYFAAANEYEGLKLLGTFVHAPGQMHTKFPVNSLADLKDKKFRLGGGMVAPLAERLGVTQVSASSLKSYEMLQQGVVDGTFLPTGEQKSFRLSEVTTNLTIFPTDLYTTTFSIIMNPDFFDSLTPEDQQALMSVSGEKLSLMAGRAWQKDAEMGIEYAKQQGINVVRLTEDDPRVLEMNALAKGIDEIWLASVNERGVDAESALAAFRKYVAQ